MSWMKNRLERERQNEIKAKYGDSLDLHEWQGCTWLVLRDERGDDILRVYGVTEEQLADLYAKIGGRLRFAPQATIEHVRRLHGLLSGILAEDETEQRRLAAEAFDEQFGPKGDARPSA